MISRTLSNILEFLFDYVHRSLFIGFDLQDEFHLLKWKLLQRTLMGLDPTCFASMEDFGPWMIFNNLLSGPANQAVRHEPFNPFQLLSQSFVY